MKTNKLLLIILCITIGVMSSIVVEAATTYGYMTRETVTKSGVSTVHSNATGTNTSSVDYGGEWETGVLYVDVQYYNEDGGYTTIHPIKETLTSKYTSFYDHAYYPAYKIFRVQLSGFSGEGSGWIKGRA